MGTERRPRGRSLARYGREPSTDRLTATVPQPLFQLDATYGDMGFDVAADGQRFLIHRLRKPTADTPVTVVLNWWVLTD